MHYFSQSWELMQMMKQSITFSIFPPPPQSSPPRLPLNTFLLHISSPCSLQLLHPVEGRSCLEPFDLCLVEAVVEFHCLLTAVAVPHDCGQRLEGSTRKRHSTFCCQLTVIHAGDLNRYLSWRKGCKSFDGDLVIRADLIIV